MTLYDGVAGIVLLLMIVAIIHVSTVWEWTCRQCGERYIGTFLEFLSPYCDSCYDNPKPPKEPE